GRNSRCFTRNYNQSYQNNLVGNYNPNRPQFFSNNDPSQNVTTNRPSPQFYSVESSTQSINRHTCQIYNKLGHLAIDCHNRMNYAFQGKIPPSRSSAMLANRTATFNYKLVC
ncbi:hypothetical protein GIB67_012676, partial [Kingdonia uniflora]